MKRKVKMLDANIHSKFSDGDLSIDQIVKISKKKKTNSDNKVGMRPNQNT